MTMNMIDLYKDLLSTASLIADDEGLISAAVGGKTTAFTVEGKRLVLPTARHQANPDKSTIVLFHPLQENILRGESKVMEKFRHAINLRLNYVIGQIAQELLGVVADVAAHKRLNPDQAVLLTKVLGGDEKTLAILHNIMKAMGFGNKDKGFVHIFLKRGGLVRGKKYNRACIVTFPLYEELCKEEAKQVYGVSVSKKHKAVLRALLEFILPGIDTPSAYDAGSESDIAPFLDCLMQGVMKLAAAINDIIDNYGEFIDRASEYRYNDEWVEAFENLAVLLPQIRAIPMQAGNEGAAAKTMPGGAVAEVATAQPATAFTTPTHAPVVAMPPVANPHHPAPHGTVAMPPPAQPTWGGAAPQPTVVRTASGAIDMAATMRTNPALAQQMNPYGAYPGTVMPPPGPVGNRMGQPRWANEGAPVYPQQWGTPPGYGGGYGGGGYGGMGRI